MIVDSSALLAVALDEPDALRFVDAMTAAARPRMSAASWFEAVMVVDRRGDAVARSRFDALVAAVGLEVVPFTAAHAAHAREAWQNFGRGRHKARLNFGDCLAYGFAKGEREALLYKGRDFAQTDIEPALKDG
jgi:ribonuclease VapC